MALIRGARGIIYFAHQFKPKFIEAGLLADEEMAAAVGAINKQIQELAPVLNGRDGGGRGDGGVVGRGGAGGGGGQAAGRVRPTSSRWPCGTGRRRRHSPSPG